MRFDDSLRTVMAADASTAHGAQSAFRQLVDLIGRHRAAAEGPALVRLRELRPHVPSGVRAASARALALAEPPAALVAFFAEDEPAIVAPILRVARLPEDEWLALLPTIGPAGRALLRARSDLSRRVMQGLAAFGSTDFTLGHGSPHAAIAAGPNRTEITPKAGGDQTSTAQTFAIADLVERIESFQRVQDHSRPPADPVMERFAFEADERGVICWVEGDRRAGLIGRRLPAELESADGLLKGTLSLDGSSRTPSSWIFSAAAMYAPESGRFQGHRGIARRQDSAAGAIEPEALRRLVHELRTPTNAIAGFAELIGTELLGPVPPVHRAHAEAIGRDVAALIGAIDDLEMSARVDGDALELSPHAIDLDSAIASAVHRAGADDRIILPEKSRLAVLADDRALDRLLVRLAETTAASVLPGSRAGVTVRAGVADVAVLWSRHEQHVDTSLLGEDFSLRLAHRLASALGGRLVTEPERLTLHLPASFNTQVQTAAH